MPIIGSLAKTVYRKLVPRPPGVQFATTSQYWDDRYTGGGNSGAGSYGRLARFKAEVINDFVAKNAVETIIEFGCGDGAQLGLAHYPHYVGIDVSSQAVELCRQKFRGDDSKQFFHTSSPEADAIKADLAMSLDVIYHLVEDNTYDAYMLRLVSAGKKYLCIYSSNDDRPSSAIHVRHRRFTDWLAQRAPQWTLVSKLANPYPIDQNRPDDTSWSDFYFFAKQ
jgi:SAM-dependent methyltransferase